MISNTLLTQHIDAHEGKVFYDNLLAYKPYSNKYFPQNRGESSTSYNRRPKIALPITSSIIDRINNILLSNISITSEDPKLNEGLGEVEGNYKLLEQTRLILTNAMATGQTLSIIRPDGWELKTGEWVWYEHGWVYATNDQNQITPVISKEQNNITYVYIDEYVWGDTTHNLGFNPSFTTKNIDSYSQDTSLGKPFPERFNNLVVEYNQVFSEVAKTLKILQSVWVTNNDIDDPSRPISLDPDKINFMGVDGTLEQVIRQVNTQPEADFLATLERHIARAAQVPSELTGIKDTTQLPSGIALALLMAPLSDLVERFEPILQDIILNLYVKSIQMAMALQGIIVPDEKLLRELIDVTISSNIYPTTAQDEIVNIKDLFKLGLITVDEARLLLNPTVSISLEEPINGNE